jgi:hypothetical protein
VVFRTLPVLTVCAAAVLSGTVSGLWVHRWAGTAELEAATARMAAIPAAVGDWDAREGEVSAREVEGAQAAGILRREYVNRRTGATLSLLVVCGRAGPVAVHTPDVCYRNSGYAEVGEATQVAVPGAEGSRLLVRRFQKQSAVPVQLRVWYCWSAGGEWEVPDNPRIHFAREPVLYKLYVSRELPRPDEPLDNDPVKEFLRDLIPQVKPALFAPPPPA